MIVVDVVADVLGALDNGLGAYLVQTGKYRAGDEARVAEPRGHVVPGLAAAVDHILAQ